MTNTKIQDNFAGYKFDDVIRMDEEEKKKKPKRKTEDKPEEVQDDAPTGEILYYVTFQKEKGRSQINQANPLSQRIKDILKKVFDDDLEKRMEVQNGGIDTNIGVSESMITTICYHEGKMYSGDDKGFMRVMPEGTTIIRNFITKDKGIIQTAPIITLQPWINSDKRFGTLPRRGITEHPCIVYQDIEGQLIAIYPDHDDYGKVPIHPQKLTPASVICADENNTIYIGIDTEIIYRIPFGRKMFSTPTILYYEDQKNKGSIDAMISQNETTLYYASNNTITKLVYNPTKLEEQNRTRIATRQSRIRALTICNGKLYDAGEDGKIYETETGKVFRNTQEGTIITAMCTGKKPNSIEEVL